MLAYTSLRVVLRYMKFMPNRPSLENVSGILSSLHLHLQPFVHVPVDLNISLPPQQWLLVLGKDDISALSQGNNQDLSLSSEILEITNIIWSFFNI